MPGCCRESLCSIWALSKLAEEEEEGSSLEVCVHPRQRVCLGTLQDHTEQGWGCFSWPPHMLRAGTKLNLGFRFVMFCCDKISFSSIFAGQGSAAEPELSLRRERNILISSCYNLIPVCLLLVALELRLVTLCAFLLAELWINCSYSCMSCFSLMHLASVPSFSSPQSSCHLLELITLNSNTNIQFAILETWNITCSAWRSSYCGKVWMWYIFNRIHRFEISCTSERCFICPGVLPFQGFHSGMSICSFFHRAYSASYTSQDARNWATTF